MLDVAVVGGSGYSGGELLRLLYVHPDARVTYVTARRFAGRAVGQHFPNLAGLSDLEFEVFDPDDCASKARLAFVALPHGHAMKVVPALLERDVRVVDLSSDFRLASSEDYETWYGRRHDAPELLDEAVYGLCEIAGPELAEARLVANPGCYPTSVILALAPMCKSGLVEREGIVVSSLSGISGAGREATDTTHFCARDENAIAYKAGGAHQHTPEMERFLSEIAGAPVTLSFVPTLAPLSRGIHTTVSGPAARAVGLAELESVYRDYYDACGFVQVLEDGVLPETKSVAGSNYCHVGLAVDERAGRLQAFSVIDNLVKGAAGQAIQNMNRMYGFAEDAGLLVPGMYP